MSGRRSHVDLCLKYHSFTEIACSFSILSKNIYKAQLEANKYKISNCVTFQQVNRALCCFFLFFGQRQNLCLIWYQALQHKVLKNWSHHSFI